MKQLTLKRTLLIALLILFVIYAPGIILLYVVPAAFIVWFSKRYNVKYGCAALIFWIGYSIFVGILATLLTLIGVLPLR